MWPPHVIIHKTITRKGRDGRMEGLGNKAMEMKLRGKSNLLLVFGAPRRAHGNNCRQVFSDPSGLKDAMRLADFFEKQKHGRTSWASIQSMYRPGKDDEKDPNFMKLDKRTGEKERILYVYLGTVFDLEGVDFDTRKKSKHTLKVVPYIDTTLTGSYQLVISLRALVEKASNLRPTTLREAFSLARIVEARFEEERLTAKVQVQELQQTTQARGGEPNRIMLVTIHHMLDPITVEENCISILNADKADNTNPPLSADIFGNNGGDYLETSGPVTPAEEVVDSGHSYTFSLVEHESPRVLQLWEIIGIGDVHELMDNKDIYNFVHLNARERMRLQAIVTGESYQGVGGSPKEASLEWTSDSYTPWAADVGRRKRLKFYVQGSERRKKKKGVNGGNGRLDCALFEASVFTPGHGSFAHRRIRDPGIKKCFFRHHFEDNVVVKEPGKDDEKDPNFVKLDKRTGEKERILYAYLGTVFDREGVDFDTRKKPVKETTLTFQCLILTSTNYTIWSMHMEVLLGIHGVWDVVDPGLADAKKNNIVKGLLFQSIPEDLVLQIGNLKTRMEMWEAIKTRNLRADRVKEARLQTLITEFENLKMSDNDTIDAYAAKLLGIASKSSTLGEVMSKHKLDVVGRLKAYEERDKEEDKANDPQENLLYARTEYSNENNESSRGRGRGSYSRGRGHGRGRGTSQNQGQCDSSKNREDNEQKSKQHEKRDLSHIQCYLYDKYRHFVSKCPKRNRNHEVNLNETQEKGVYHEEVSDKRQYPVMILVSMRDSWGSLLIKVPSSANRLYKAQLKVGKEDTNEVGQESEDNSRIDDTLIPLARLETIQLLIALAAGKGWKIHHLDVKTAFLNGDQKKLDSIKVSQGKDCVEIKQERYARKILKEARMEDYNATLYLMKKVLKLSKAEDEPEVEATQYQKMVGFFCYLLHTHPDLAYLVGVVSTTSFRIKYKRGNDVRLVGYRSHNVDIDDGRSTNGHVFYGTSPITWCLQKQTTVALSSCEAEFMADTAAACQAIWLREVLAEVMENEQVQEDEIVIWCARVTLFDSKIQGVIVGEFLKSNHGLWRGLGFNRYKLECESNSTMFT
ncbi:uncharacterized mitochondrial protein-like protein [Tanacetum coccineum]